ncbi:hypothetical protein NBRC111894_4179 [Sporolactobacillus inulinus]|uniref:Uncharacterized protein n=1 Tax=Sporolactobacillus inulinus TaxID=2078 RepID=A0A4Y1ZHL3_9BACL|nr:hypothetical protein NBRC111894_4179 [Sporolactobacillus inulinus]
MPVPISDGGACSGMQYNPIIMLIKKDKLLFMTKQKQHIYRLK